MCFAHENIKKNTFKVGYIRKIEKKIRILPKIAQSVRKLKTYIALLMFPSLR
jgi:hypothetical protein